VLITGYGLGGDIRRLKESYPQHEASFNLDSSSVVDLSTTNSNLIVPSTTASFMGLSQLCAQVLGKGINKSMQLFPEVIIS
jgi:hypothetical protein